MSSITKSVDGYRSSITIQFHKHSLCVTKQYLFRNDAVSFRDSVYNKIKDAMINKVEFLEIDNYIINVRQIDYVRSSIAQVRLPMEEYEESEILDMKEDMLNENTK